MSRARAGVTLAAAGMVVAGACGGGGGGAGGSEADAARTVEVKMVDIAFEPDRLEAKAGETVEFVFTNTGMAEHEAVLGDAGVHEREERVGGHSGGHAGHGSDGVPRVVLDPGKEGKLTYTFNEPGEVFIGCHISTHWKAGMKVAITVGE